MLLLVLPPMLNGCGPLLGEPPNDAEPTDEDLYGAVNTITIRIQGQANNTVLPANGLFKHITINATDSVPKHTILTGSGRASADHIAFKIIQDGDEISVGGYDGVSSLFSLDGLVYFDLQINGERYNSLVYGIGAGGNTVYYNSWFTVNQIHTTDYQQPPGERRLMLLKGQFKAILKQYYAPDDAAEIVIEGTINYQANE